MASVDKVKLGEVTYDVSPSATGTLNGFSSGDNVTPAWSEVNTISSGDTNSTIFSKLTTMVKNVRWLYAKLGNEDLSTTGQSTVTGSLSSLQGELDGKSNESHTHTVDSLPVSNNQVNSASYIPTSALLYSMSMRAEGIESVVNTAKNELSGPNKRYERKYLGTWSSVSQVDTFLSTYTHENNYEGLSLGNYVTIRGNDWAIAGFDMECNQMAADGTIYDNGYGICLIPKTYIEDADDQWSGSYYNTYGGYISSGPHTTTLPSIDVKLINALGDHIINRNVLLSSSTDGTYSNAYTWDMAYSTLMSIGQITGTFASNNNKYDDGEANYKLPLFNNEDYNIGSCYWTRGIAGKQSAWAVLNSGSIRGVDINTYYPIRPLIYIR